MKVKYRSKKLLILMALILAFSIIGCGNKNQSSSINNAKEQLKPSENNQVKSAEDNNKAVDENTKAVENIKSTSDVKNVLNNNLDQLDKQMNDLMKMDSAGIQ